MARRGGPARGDLRAGRGMKDGRWRALAPFGLIAVAISLIWWRGPDWHLVRDTFTVVRWPWIVAAVGLNLLSVVVRARRLEHRHPRGGRVAAAQVPQRLLRVLRRPLRQRRAAGAGRRARAGGGAARRMPGRRGSGRRCSERCSRTGCSTSSQRSSLVVWVLSSAQLPHWAVMTVFALLGIGLALFVFAILGARGATRTLARRGSGARVCCSRARDGLAIMRGPLPAAGAATFQFAGWFFQLLAVCAAMRGFRIYEPLVAAGLVLLMVNVVTVVPFWPGNIGLVQAAVAVSLAQYGVRYAKGFAFGIGLQLIEASVGIGIGTIFLAREGISFATLREMESEGEAENGARPPRQRLPRRRARSEIRDEVEDLRAPRRGLPDHLASRLDLHLRAGRALVAEPLCELVGVLLAGRRRRSGTSSAGSPGCPPPRAARPGRRLLRGSAGRGAPPTPRNRPPSTRPPPAPRARRARPPSPRGSRAAARPPASTGRPGDASGGG